MKLKMMAIVFALDPDGRVAFRRGDLVEVEWCPADSPLTLKFCDEYRSPAWSWFDLRDYDHATSHETPEQYFARNKAWGFE